MKNTELLPHCRWCSSQRRWVVKRPSPWPPEPRPEPMPGLGAMPPLGGGPLPSRSRIIPLPTMPREPPGPLSLRLMSRRSSPPPRVSRSRTALVFFSSTFRRTSPRNMMGCREKSNVTTEEPRTEYFPVPFHNPHHSLVCTQVCWSFPDYASTVLCHVGLTWQVLCPCQWNNLISKVVFRPTLVLYDKNAAPSFVWVQPVCCCSWGANTGFSGNKRL